MARVKNTKASASEAWTSCRCDAIQRPSAEILHADELERLARDDGGAPRPSGWSLTPAIGPDLRAGRRGQRDRPQVRRPARLSWSVASSRWRPTAA